MKLRTRLGLGIVSITIILLIPLLLALQALERVHQTTRSLRDRQFAASFLLGSFRETTDAVKRSEDALILLADSASEARMRTHLNRLSVVADSLAGYTSRPVATDISNAILALRTSTQAEFAAAVAGANNTAEEISVQRTRPALATIERELARTEAKLRDETRDRVDEAASTTLDARRTAAGSLAIALLLATLVAIWLTRSISRPVQDLERGMKAVA
ncbi:MAG: hypothetical protein M3R07_07990, partial [Gemmatimonadota bacterium]|nr:hypothetical protein [Gemmatimonadota bacterium]